MILVEYRMKAKNPRKEITRFLEIQSSNVLEAREQAKELLGNNVRIIKALFVGTYLEK